MHRHSASVMSTQQSSSCIDGNRRILLGKRERNNSPPCDDHRTPTTLRRWYAHIWVAKLPGASEHTHDKPRCPERISLVDALFAATSAHVVTHFRKPWARICLAASALDALSLAATAKCIGASWRPSRLTSFMRQCTPPSQQPAHPPMRVQTLCAKPPESRAARRLASEWR